MTDPTKPATPEGDPRKATNVEQGWFNKYAHDIRTPLGIVTGHLEMLSDPRATAAHRLLALKAIVEATSRLQGVTITMLFDQLDEDLPGNGIR